MSIAQGTRVISRFGWATVSSVDRHLVSALLDVPTASSDVVTGAAGDFVVPAPYAVCRIIDLGELGYFGNASFVPVGMAPDLYHDAPRPSNEMRFLFELGRQRYQGTDEFGEVVLRRYLRVATWVDRWGTVVKPSVDIFTRPTIGEWIEDYQQRIKNIPSGIGLVVLLDRHSNEIAWSGVICASGWVPLTDPKAPVNLPLL